MFTGTFHTSRVVMTIFSKSKMLTLGDIFYYMRCFKSHHCVQKMLDINFDFLGSWFAIYNKHRQGCFSVLLDIPDISYFMAYLP